MKTGDSVTITKRAINPYIMGRNSSMTGLQGRIFSKYKDGGEIFVEIEFDSVSLREMKDAYIKKVLESDTDFACVDIPIKSLSLSEPRDTPEDVIAARKEICKKYDYISVLDDGTCEIWKNLEETETDEEELTEVVSEEDGLMSFKVSACRVKMLMVVMARVEKERKREKARKFIKLPVRKRKKK